MIRRPPRSTRTDTLFPYTTLFRSNVAIAVEPGDYIVKDAGMLLLSVTDVEWKRDVRFVYVNGGFNLHPEPAFYDLPCEPVPCIARRGEREAVTIAGNINEVLDIRSEGRRVGKECVRTCSSRWWSCN